MITDPINKIRFDAVISRMGDLYTYEDIMQCIQEGKMQSFASGNTWVVTEVHQYPQRKVLDILFLIGDMADTKELHDAVIGFASKIGASLIRSIGRTGWTAFIAENGWSIAGTIYHKEM